MLRSRSTRSTLPSLSQATTTTRMPAMTALAALVPCALDGMRQTSRSIVTVGPVVRPDGEQAGELALGTGVGLHAHRVVPGHLGQPALELRRPAPCTRPSASAGANGCMLANSGQVTGSISVVALSFIVHDPSGIMPRSSA